MIVDRREATGPNPAAASDELTDDEAAKIDTWIFAGQARPLDRAFALADRLGAPRAGARRLPEPRALEQVRESVLGLRGSAGPVQRLSEVLAPDQVLKILRAAENGNEVQAVYLATIYADDMVPTDDDDDGWHLAQVAELADVARDLCRRLAPVAGMPRWLSGRVRDILAALLHAEAATADVEARSGQAALDDDPRRDLAPPGRLIVAAPAAPNAPNLRPSLAAFTGEGRTGAPCGSALAA